MGRLPRTWSANCGEGRRKDDSALVESQVTQPSEIVLFFFSGTGAVFEKSADRRIFNGQIRVSLKSVRVVLEICARTLHRRGLV